MDVRRVGGDLGRRCRAAVEHRVGVDARALAAFRVTLAALLLFDLLLRSRSLVAFYTDAGVLPREALRAHSPLLYRLSLHTVSGATWAQALLFVAAGVAALALLVGYRPTLAGAVSWLLLVSLHARNPFVLDGGDGLLRWLLLWGLFLPLGARWSVRSRGGSEGERRSPDRVANAASAALLAQALVVYVVNAALKLRGDAWVGGDAVRYVFSLDGFTVLLGDVLARHPAVLGPLADLWLAMLCLSPLLVLLTGRARTLFVSAFGAAHLGMALTMNLGLFPLVSIAALIPFLPESVWDRVERAVAVPLGRRLDAILGSAGGPRHGPTSMDTPSPPRVVRLRERWRRLRSPVAAALLAVVLVWNAGTLGLVAFPQGGGPDTDPSAPRWDMFAPNPPTVDGWYVVPGRLESGAQVDVFRGGPVRWAHPPDVADTYPSARWRKYAVGLRRTDDEARRRAFAGYLCQRWNRTHEDDVRSLTLYYVEQPTRLSGPEPTRRVELGGYSCRQRDGGARFYRRGARREMHQPF